MEWVHVDVMTSSWENSLGKIGRDITSSLELGIGHVYNHWKYINANY